MRKLWIGAVLLLGAPAAQAGTLAVYTFTGLPGDERSVLPDGSPPNPLASELTRSDAITPRTGANSINSDNWDTGGGFYAFTITPGPGQTLNLGSLEYTDRRSPDGPNSIDVRFSLDKFVTSTSIGAYTLADAANHRETFDLTGFGSLVNLTSAATFHIFATGATDPNGTYRLGTAAGEAGANLPANLVINAAAAVPEPASLSLLGLGLIGVGCYGWHRRTRTAA